MKIYLTDLNSDVSGYKLALVDTRNPSPPAALVTSVTTTTGSGDNIQATATPGGTALAWITKPMLVDVVVPGEAVLLNVWAKEDAGTTNTGVGCRLHEYTNSEQAAFLDFNGTTELGTSIARSRQLTSNPTPTTIDAGNRLVIKIDAVAAGGTMAAGQMTVDYDGPTPDADGDTYLEIPVSARLNERQLGTGNCPLPQSGFGKGFYQGVIDNLVVAVGAKLISTTATVQSVIDDLGFERDNT